MVCKITSTKRRRAGFTLPEMLIAVGVGAIVLLAVASLSLYTSRNFAALANYLDLDAHSQQTLDKMSKEIRQMKRLTAQSATELVFEQHDGGTLKYVYDPAAKTLERIKGEETTTLLTGCDSLQFSAYQRTPDSATFEPYPATDLATAKVVEIKWNCSRTILQAKANTESMQSAKIAIRQK